MRDKGFFGKVLHVNRCALGEPMPGRHDKRKLIAKYFRGHQLCFAWHKGNRAQVEPIIEHLVRYVPLIGSVHSNLDVRTQLPELRRSEEQGMDRAFIYA